MTDEQAVQQFEAFVQGQKPASTPWQPVTDYSFEARKAIEGIHPRLIKDVFDPTLVMDVGCGPGHLVTLLRELGVNVSGCDRTNPTADYEVDITEDDWLPFRSDLVICREVLEHLTVIQIKRAVAHLVALSSKYIYVTTRFAQQPTHLLSVDDHDDLDPTHITMLTKPFLRTLFILEGCKSRYDLEERMDHKKLGRVLVFEVT